MILRCEVGVKLRCEKVRKGGVGTVSLQGRGKREGETSREAPPLLSLLGSPWVVLSSTRWAGGAAKIALSLRL